MASKANVKQKNQQMALICDEISKMLMIVDLKKLLLFNKMSKAVTGTTVTWQDSSRERWRGPILVIGSEDECTKLMATIEKNMENTSNDTSKSKKNQEKQSIQPTIIIDPTDSEEVEMDDNEDDENNSSQLHITDEEQEKENTPLDKTTDTSTSSVSTSIRGEKRPHEEGDTKSNKRKKRSSGSLTVPYHVYAAKEKECVILQAQVSKYEQEYMPRPKAPQVVQYFIDVANILSGSNDDGEDEDEGDVLTNIMKELKMSEKDLQLCHRKSATTTVRKIMKHLYPNPDKDCQIKTIDESILNAVVKYTRISNPTDPTPEADIRHAMSNYLAAHKFKNKPNETPESNRATQ